jgi:DNA-binding HxlR family transcriptional regulator
MHRCRRCEPVPEEVRRAADLLERRWLLQVLYAAHTGAVRFNEFRQAVGAVPPRTLAQRLQELEEAGIIERRVVDARPPRVEYRLTDLGRRLEIIIDALGRWAAQADSARAKRQPEQGTRERRPTPML